MPEIYFSEKIFDKYELLWEFDKIMLEVSPAAIMKLDPSLLAVLVNDKVSLRVTKLVK